MRHTAEAVRAALGAPPRITSRPTQTLLWALKTHLVDGLRTLKHPDHPDKGYAPYIRTNQEQALVSSRPWQDPADPGLFFVPSRSAVTDRLISIEESGWNAQKAVSNSFDTIKSVLTHIFTKCVPEAYHSGATAMGQKGFGNLAPREILFRLVHLCGRPTTGEIQQALQRLMAPMDRLAPVEVVLRGI